jgi:hypothetical protein
MCPAVLSWQQVQQVLAQRQTGMTPFQQEQITTILFTVEVMAMQKKMAEPQPHEGMAAAAPPAPFNWTSTAGGAPPPAPFNWTSTNNSLAWSMTLQSTSINELVQAAMDKPLLRSIPLLWEALHSGRHKRFAGKACPVLA